MDWFRSPNACHLLSDDHERIQKNTFTRWINFHLDTHSSSGKVANLYEDIKDGVFLCELIEVLTGDCLPTNRARLSKRVHHLSNLTTALQVLRKRGLELVNNNPADLADGNPRIVLGLIWQMIWHFQVESNVKLLREWGWEQDEHVSVPVSDSSAVAMQKPSSSGVSAEPSHDAVSRSKANAERVLLRWLNKQYGLSATDFDKCWRDGVLFNALVHRSAPDRVNMAEVRKRQPDANLSAAFELAREVLGVRPLLSVEDMHRPDKRAILTYVSQFVRKTAVTALPVDVVVVEQGHEQHVAYAARLQRFMQWQNELLLRWKKIAIRPADFNQYDVFLAMRKEFLEKRLEYADLKALKGDDRLPEGDMDEMNAKWHEIGTLLTEFSRSIEASLPGRLSYLSRFLADAEKNAQTEISPLDAKASSQQALIYIGECIQQHKASLSQRETTRDRSKEIETQLHEVQDMLLGLQHVTRTAKTLPIVTSVAETELEQTDVALQKLNDMLTRLDRLSTDGVQEGQLNELSKQKRQVNSAIERVWAWRVALIRQLKALRQWHDDQTKCQSDTTQICRQAQQLCDRYSQGPQPLQVGMDDLKAAENLQTAIWDQQKVLQVVMDRVCGQLPDPRQQAEEVERLKGEMNESSTNLKTLTNALEKAVQQEGELLQQQTSAIDRLNALSGEVMNMHSIEGNTPQQLQDLRAQTEPIKGIVQQLEHDAARSPSLVFHSEHLNALAVRAQLDNLVALLNEKQEDATARLMLAAQVTTIAENKTMLQDTLKSAAAIEKDENATLESVNFALEILEKDGRPHLSVIEQTYSQLTSAPEADAVRAQALSDMTNLGENLKTLQLQLDDRYAGMRAFDEKCGALENLLTETEILASADLQERSQLEKAQLALDSIRPRMAQIEVDAVELQPMRVPTQKVADFQARQARLGVKMQDARQKIESDERLQAAIRDAEDLLARIDDQLLPIESLLADASSSREDLVHVCQDRLPTADRLIEELHKRLDSEEEHASELHSISDCAAAARRQFVEADRTVQLRLREMDDEQRLIDHITQQLQDAETVLDNLSTSDLHPQPLEQAVQDLNLLAVLLEQLHSIDLPAIRNAKNRTLLQERVAKVGERVQRLHDDLNDKVDEQNKILEKLRDSLTQLNLIGDEISALPTDELDRHIAQMNTIQQRLEDLIPTARIVDSAIDRPAKYILRPPVDRPLVERIVELQSILRDRQEAATQLMQLKTTRHQDQMQYHMIEFDAIEIGRYISKGAYGVISEVKLDGVFGKYVMKLFDKRLKYDEEKIKLMLQLKHPNVIELHKYCIEPFCLLMVLCKCSLHDVIQGKDLISAQDFTKYARQLAAGMQYMHSQNIAHRDLKSDNVLLTMDSDIKICDLDRSKSLNLADVLTLTQAGTPMWMAPEMLTGKKYGASVSCEEWPRFIVKVDIWSFAVILWEMLTQRFPYDSVFGQLRDYADLHNFSIGLSKCEIRLSFPPGTPQLLCILLSECLLAETNRRPNFEKIANGLASLEIEKDIWTTLKPLWREIPFDYTYSKEEEEDFITRREYFTLTGKRWEELIENFTKTGEDLENKTWNLETIKDIINKRGLTWKRDISYWEEFALEEPNVQNLRRLFNENKSLKHDYNDYINKIKQKVLWDEAIELSILGLGNGNVKMRIHASELLFHVIQNETRSPEEMVELIISSVKAEEDVELVMNCSILLTLPIMRPVFIGRSCLFLVNVLRVHLKNAKMTNLFLFIFDGLNDSLRKELSVQMVETSLVESIMKSLISSENIENILVRNWWRILLLLTALNTQSSLIFIKNRGIQCFHKHTKRYWHDPWILEYIFRVIHNVVFHSSPRSQFLTSEFVEEHFRFIRLTSEHALMCHFAVDTLAILLRESTWEKVKMPKSSCSKALVKIIMAWSLTTKWIEEWTPVLSIEDNEVTQLYEIFRLLKTRQMSFSSEDRSESLKTLEALIKDSKKTDDLRTYAKVARKLLEATKR